MGQRLGSKLYQRLPGLTVHKAVYDDYICPDHREDPEYLRGQYPSRQYDRGKGHGRGADTSEGDVTARDEEVPDLAICRYRIEI